MKNRKLATLIIILSLIFIALGITILVYPSLSINKPKLENPLYFVTVSDAKYGIIDINGNVLVASEFSKIMRLDDVVYLKSDAVSYILDLTTNIPVSIGNKETDSSLVYDKNGNLLPYFVLQYGTGSGSLYKVYAKDGNASDFFATKEEALNSIGAVSSIISVEPSNTIKSKYTVVKRLDYRTNTGKIQFIVKEGNQNGAKFGIVDEDGNIILPLVYSAILSGNEDGNDLKAAVKINKADLGKEYLFFRSGKTVEVEKNFEYVVFDKEYYIRKKGATLNRVYNINGDIIIDGIYTYPTDFNFVDYGDNKSYAIYYNTNGNCDIYDLTGTTTEKKSFPSIMKEYLSTYNSKAKLTSLVYISSKIYYCISLENFEKYKINTKLIIYSPLDYETVYGK